MPPHAIRAPTVKADKWNSHLRSHSQWHWLHFVLQTPNQITPKFVFADAEKNLVTENGHPMKRKVVPISIITIKKKKTVFRVPGNVITCNGCSERKRKEISMNVKWRKKNGCGRRHNGSTHNPKGKWIQREGRKVHYACLRAVNYPILSCHCRRNQSIFLKSIQRRLSAYSVCTHGRTSTSTQMHHIGRECWRKCVHSWTPFRCFFSTFNTNYDKKWCAGKRSCHRLTHTCFGSDFRRHSIDALRSSSNCTLLR